MTAAAPPDSQHRRLIDRLPRTPRALALLARLDRPIGWWLLFWPGAAAVLLGGGLSGQWWLLGLLLVGSIAMRGAGCVYNDIVDRDLDARVARTATRLLPAGLVSLRLAWGWLVTLCLVGLVVLWQLPRLAQGVALGSLLPVAAYPFMKRVTWWPQAWLGVVFSWAAPVGWVAATGGVAPALGWLYGGCVAWVVGYDTIYAVQDREDDALVGVKSSARAMGSHVRGGVALCYALALGLWSAALWSVRPDPVGLAALLPVAVQLGWQVATLDLDDGAGVLARFRSNRTAGLLLALACAAVGSASSA
jgi:4-hydroxybenzoate polyprenyltransferase